MRAPRILIAVVAVASLLLAGCGDSEPQSTDETPTSSATTEPDETNEPSEPESEEESPEPEGTVVDITIKGERVEPSGARVEADLGEPITLQITADHAGELHVHSTPEQTISFGEGTTQAELTFDQPGVVHVEDHHTGLVIVQLEVS